MCTAVEVPLDGTVYDLATGKVLSWCPKNSLVRGGLACCVCARQQARTRGGTAPLAALLVPHPSHASHRCPCPPLRRCARCWAG